MQLTRRKLLAGVGLGAIGAGGLVFSGNRPQYTHYTYAATDTLDDQQVRVAWYERYNGTFQENQNGTTDDDFDAALDPDSAPEYVDDAELVTGTTGPVIALGNVMPGDEGTLVVGLEASDDDEVVSGPLDIWLRAAITADEERGINGPEWNAGDTTATDGELDDEVFVELWRDGSPLGSCNGTKEFDERLEGPTVERAPLGEAFGPTSDVASSTGLLVVDSLQAGGSRCLALAWEFPSDAATNASQGDTVGFDILFGAVPSGAPSPFSAGTEVAQ